MFYSVFHNSRAFKCVDANFVFSQKNDVTLTRHDVMTRSHRKSSLAPFRAENIFRKSHKRNFDCWSSCLSNRQKCGLGVIFLRPPLAVEGLKMRNWRIMTSYVRLEVSSLLFPSILVQNVCSFSEKLDKYYVVDVMPDICQILSYQWSFKNFKRGT